MNRFLLLVITLLFSIPFASAYEFKTNGISSYHQLNKEYYLLLLASEKMVTSVWELHDSSIAKRFEMRVTTDEWTPQNFTKTWIRDLSINNDLDSHPEITRELIKFAKLPKSPLIAGDAIVIEYTPKKGTTVNINGVGVMQSVNPQFFNYMVNSWLGKYPPSRKFRDDILSGGNLDIEASALKGSFESIKHSATRKNLVAEWQEIVEKKKAVIAAKERKQREVIRKRKQAAALIQKAEKEVAKLERTKAEVEKEKAALSILARLEAEDVVQMDSQFKQKTLSDKSEKNSDEGDAFNVQVDSKYQLALYEWEMQRKVYSEVKYPHWAKQLSQKGKVSVDFILRKDGSIEKFTHVDAKKAELLGKELKRAIQAAAPFPGLPDSVDEYKRAFSISYDFKDGKTAAILPKKPQQIAGYSD